MVCSDSDITASVDSGLVCKIWLPRLACSNRPRRFSKFLRVTCARICLVLASPRAGFVTVKNVNWGTIATVWLHEIHRLRMQLAFGIEKHGKISVVASNVGWICPDMDYSQIGKQERNLIFLKRLGRSFLISCIWAVWRFIWSVWFLRVLNLSSLYCSPSCL